MPDLSENREYVRILVPQFSPLTTEYCISNAALAFLYTPAVVIAAQAESSDYSRLPNTTYRDSLRHHPFHTHGRRRFPAAPTLSLRPLAPLVHPTRAARSAADGGRTS